MRRGKYETQSSKERTKLASANEKSSTEIRNIFVNIYLIAFVQTTLFCLGVSYESYRPHIPC